MAVLLHSLISRMWNRLTFGDGIVRCQVNLKHKSFLDQIGMSFIKEMNTETDA